MAGLGWFGLVGLIGLGRIGLVVLIGWVGFGLACMQALLAGLGYNLGKEKTSRCAKRAEGGTGRVEGKGETK